ncbi:MFS transporter [Paenibacillus sp. MSJ-34]|nr:MFS transporter [Paenibacillus sp. MSJ-34]
MPLPPDKKLSKEAKVSIAIHGLYQLGASMAGVFLSLYLWRLTEDIFVNGMYNIILYFVSPIVFMLGGWIAKTKDRLLVYRLGIVFTVLFYLLVLIAREKVVEYMPVFAVLNGIANSFYWLGYLTLMYDVSTNRNRIRYLGMNSVLFNFAGLAGPALAGFLISLSQGLNGYVVVFGIAFVMFFLTALGSFRLKSKSSLHRKYYLHLVPKIMKRDKRWLKSLCGWLVIGLLQGTMLFLPNILLYNELKQESLVGYTGVFLTGLVIASSYVLTRIGNEHSARKYMAAAALGFTFGSLLLFMHTSVWTVLVFLALYSIFNPVQGNTYSAYTYRIIGNLPLKDNVRVETIILRETFLNTGRICSIVIFLSFASNLEAGAIPWILLAVSLIQFATVAFMEKTEISE